MSVQKETTERKAPLLPLWHNCSCEHNLCSTPELTQVTPATRHWWVTAEHMPARGAVNPRFLRDSRIQPVLKLQLRTACQQDAKDALTEVLICGMRVNYIVGHHHFHPHASSPQCSSKQCFETQVPCATEQPQQHNDMTASFSFPTLSQGPTTHSWIVALNPATP